MVTKRQFSTRFLCSEKLLILDTVPFDCIDPNAQLVLVSLALKTGRPNSASVEDDIRKGRELQGALLCISPDDASYS